MSERTVLVSSLVALPAATLVGLLGTPAILRYVCWPLLTFPDDEALVPAVDGSVEVPLTALGLIGLWSHVITVVEFDEGGMVTEEHGGPLRRWRHRLSVEPVDATTAFYRDEVVFDAGALSAVSVPVVRAFYRWRHRRWRRLARRLVRA